MRRTLVTLIAVTLNAGLWACGLEMCSMPSAAPARGVRAQYFARSTGFRSDGVEGRYHQVIARAEYRAAGPWSFGAHAPYTSLVVRGHGGSGAGNPVLFVEYARGAAAFGSQVEVPVHSAATAIAADHAEWMPYAGWTGGRGAVRWHGRAGFLVALSGGHGRGDGHAPLFVNPHADKQLAARAGARLPRAAGAPEVYLDGQRALSGGHAGNELSAGVAVAVPLGHLEMRPSAEFPLTGGTRARWRTGVALAGRF